MSYLPDFCTPQVDPSNVPPVSGWGDAWPVVNVLEHIRANATASELLDPVRTRERIRDAASRIPDAGGLLYFPPGVYELASAPCSPIAIRSRTLVLGAGSATVLRNMTKGGLILWLYGVEDVTIRGLSFDINHGVCSAGDGGARNYAVAVAAGSPPPTSLEPSMRTRRIRVERCLFRTSGTPIRGQTLHAVLIQNAEDVWVHDNRVERLQIKAAGDLGCTRVSVHRNHIVDPHNFGISAVTKAPGGVLADIRITSNIIENLPSGGGIFAGTDGESGEGELCTNLVIRNNIVRGRFSGTTVDDRECTGQSKGHGAAVAILLDAPRVSSNWTIEGNVVENTGSIEPGVGGIRIVPSVTNESLRGVRIAHNTVSGTDQAGILVAGATDQLSVVGNCLDRTRGIVVTSERHGLASGVIANNIIHGGSQGVHVSADGGSIRGMSIVGNVVHDTSVQNQHVGVTLASARGGTVDVEVLGNTLHGGGIYTRSVGIREDWDGATGGRISTRLDANVIHAQIPLASCRASVNIVGDNLGLPTTAKGASMFGAGDSICVVEHGLGIALGPRNFSVGAIAAPDHEPLLVWAESADARYATFRCSRPPVRNVAFSWLASLTDLTM